MTSAFGSRKLFAQGVIGLGLLGSFFFIAMYFGFGERDFTREAHVIVALCRDAQNRGVCYDKEIPKLMDRGFSMEDSFDVTRIVQELDTTYVYCHVLGHVLAEKETSKDPHKWLEVVHRAPSGICSNGAIHGAFQERFRTEALPDAEVEELKPILRGACRASDEWRPTRLEQATCTHALGHLTMYITGADINKSLQTCDAVAYNEAGYDFRQLCYDGAFMQIYQPLEPEDFDLIVGKEVVRATRDGFCRRFSGAAHDSCITESWPLYREELFTGDGFADFCGVFPRGSSSEERCARGIAYVATALLSFEENAIAQLCGALDDPLRAICFSSAASRMIETDWRNIHQAAVFCRKAESYGAGQACYEELATYATYNFHRGSSEARALCRELPLEFRSRCNDRHI